MQVTTTSPLTLALHRSGGCVITARLDIWSATASDWVLIASNVFQNVVLVTETQNATLKKGTYLAILAVRVEESINGAFAFKFDVNGATVATKSGDVDSTSDPHDSMGFKSQFMLVII